MIIDASVVIDAVADPGGRGDAARSALRELQASESLSAPGHLAIEVLSGLVAAARRPGHPMKMEELADALRNAEDLGISIEATRWPDVVRAWELAQTSIRYADALYVAAAERYRTTLLTADTKIAKSGANFRCDIHTVN